MRARTRERTHPGRSIPHPAESSFEHGYLLSFSSTDTSRGIALRKRHDRVTEFGELSSWTSGVSRSCVRMEGLLYNNDD
jgi:hypothetical protein